MVAAAVLVDIAAVVGVEAAADAADTAAADEVGVEEVVSIDPALVVGRVEMTVDSARTVWVALEAVQVLGLTKPARALQRVGHLQLAAILLEVEGLEVELAELAELAPASQAAVAWIAQAVPLQTHPARQR